MAIDSSIWSIESQLKSRLDIYLSKELAQFMAFARVDSWLEFLRQQDSASGIPEGSIEYSAENWLCLYRAFCTDIGLPGLNISSQTPPLVTGAFETMMNLRVIPQRDEVIIAVLKSIADFIGADDLSVALFKLQNGPKGPEVTASALEFSENESESVQHQDPEPELSYEAAGAMPPEAETQTGSPTETVSEAPASDPQNLPTEPAFEHAAASEGDGPSSTAITQPKEFDENLLSDFSIEIEALDLISYPYARNGISPVSEIRLVHQDGPGRGPIQIHADLMIDDVVLANFVSEEFYLADDESKRLERRDLNFELSSAALTRVESRMTAHLRVRAVWNKTVIAETKTQVEVLPPALWQLASEVGSTGLSLTMLAAYVTPHHPAIMTLLGEASQILGRSTGDPSIQGYQDGPERADAIVKAIFEAMRARGITYIDPPASWGLGGQVIRTPDQVLDEGFGTCLDTTIVMAAALEQAGINPHVCVIEGHAFLGYDRAEFGILAPLYADPSEYLLERVDKRRVGFVETTKVTKGNETVSWEDIQSEPRRLRIAQDFSNFWAAVSVFGARSGAGILPLPVRVLDDSTGSEQVINYNPTFVGGTPVDWQGKARSEESEQTGPVPERVLAWKNALLDLSGSNQLINMRTNRTVELVVPAETTGRFEDIINAGKTITLLPADQLPETALLRGIKQGSELPTDLLNAMLDEQFLTFTNQSEKSYGTVLRRLQLQAKNYRQETGANNLYLSFGTLNWRHMGKEFKSPLVLVPVRLEILSRKGLYRLVLDDAGESAPNYCLLEKLSKELSVEIPGLRNPVMDESGINIAAAFDSVRAAVAEAKLDWRIDHSVHLGILQFAKFRLWKDLDDNWSELIQNPLVNHLVHSNNEPFVDPAADAQVGDPEDLMVGLPIPADAAQLNAVNQALAGKTFVLEGPPGTGKSQAITNILARSISEGKKVLFVAEKSEALAVVKKRLAGAGLGTLSLFAHDKGAKADQVKAQLKEALDLYAEFDEAELDSAFQAVQTSRTALIRYRHRIASQNGAGYSLYSARQVFLDPDKLVEPMALSSEFVGSCSREDIQNIRMALERATEFGGAARPSADNPWRFITTPFESGEIDVVLDIIHRVDTLAEQLNSQLALRPALQAARNVEDLVLVAAVCGNASANPGDFASVASAAWRESANAFAQRCEDFAKIPQPTLLTFKPDVLSLDTTALQNSANAIKGMGFSEKRGMRTSLIETLTPFVQQGKRLKPGKVTQYIDSIVALKRTVTKLTSSAVSISGLNVTAQWNPFLETDRQSLRAQIEHLHATAQALSSATNSDAGGSQLHAALRDAIQANLLVDAPTKQLLTQFVGTVRELVAALNIDTSAVTSWAARDGFVATWLRGVQVRSVTATSDHASLQTWNNFIAALSPLAHHHLDAALGELLNGSIKIDDANEAFNLGLGVASVDERLIQTGLQEFEQVAHERQIDRYRAGLRKIRELLPDVLPNTIVSKRPFDARSNSGRIGMLRQQLERKRGGLTLRGIFNEFSDVITTITPCIMMSPESVARLFPAKRDLFDLVIFDEASQLRVADAIGSMGRGKAVVVVGDDKQMPPSNFFSKTSDAMSANASEEMDSLEELLEVFDDQESILSECVQAVVPTHTLTWHYRSQDEALISFSNLEYYDEQLASFPSPLFGTRDDGPQGHGISFRKIETGDLKVVGTQLNEIEADAVVEEVRQRFAAAPEGELPSIGIITFNKQYAELIDKKLLALRNDRITEALEDDEGIFVKSIEYVQGDERDTILFAVGKTADPATNEVALTGFGPIATFGGQRRLNVAITRARRQVIVFCSFEPEQLDAKRSLNPGLKHLQKYLAEAKKGSENAMHSTYRQQFRDLHRDEIATQLKLRGLDVATDIGLSEFRVDLALSYPNKNKDAKIAVLLDSPRWAKRTTVVDRDALPRDVLENLMKWPAVERVWLPDWLQNPDDVLERLTRRLEKVATGVESEDASVVHAENLIETGQIDRLTERPGEASSQIGGKSAGFPFGQLKTAEMATSSNQIDFVECKTSVQAGREYLDSLPWHPQAVAAVASAIEQIVNIEGPIHTTRLAKLTAACFDLTKVSPARIDAILSSVPNTVTLSNDEPFAWPSGINSANWLNYRRTPEGVSRPIDQVSKVEIANAMADLTARNLGMSADELKREAAAIFGTKRLTSAIDGYLEEAIAVGVRLGRLEQSDGGIYQASIDQ